MACVSLAVSLLFERKTRSLNKLSRRVNVSVFDRSYNILSVYLEPRKRIDDIILWPISIILVFAFLAIGFSKIFGFGLSLGFIVLTGSLSLMMVDEAAEINSTANQFTKALTAETGFGKGDVVALYLLKQTMPKLKRYYILLATLFVISAMMIPYVVDAVASTFAQALGSMMAITSKLGVLSPFLSVLIFTAIVTIITGSTGRIKTRAFGPSPSSTLTSIEEQFNRIMNMTKVEDPEE